MCGLSWPSGCVLLVARDTLQDLEHYFVVMRHDRSDEALRGMLRQKARDHRLRTGESHISAIPADMPFMSLLGSLQSQRSSPHSINGKLLRGLMVHVGSRQPRALSRSDAPRVSLSAML